VPKRKIIVEALAKTVEALAIAPQVPVSASRRKPGRSSRSRRSATRYCFTAHRPAVRVATTHERYGRDQGLSVRDAEVLLVRRVRGVLLVATRPFGYLAFVAALAALSASAKLLGHDHALGFFAGRLN
jgi:hypothetical protein